MSTTDEENFIRSVKSLLESSWDLLKEGINPGFAEALYKFNDDSDVNRDFHSIMSKDAYLKAITQYALLLFRDSGFCYQDFSEKNCLELLYTHFKVRIPLASTRSDIQCLKIMNLLSIKDLEAKTFHPEDVISGLCSKLIYGVRLVVFSKYTIYFRKVYANI